MMFFQLFTATLLIGGLAAPTSELSHHLSRPPSQDPFYAVPENITRYAPGQIIAQRQPPLPIAALGLSRINLESSYQLSYRTNDNHGNATATVTTVLIPRNADKTKVLSYQVAEDASSINCAPSYAFQFLSATGPLGGTIVTQLELLLIMAALEQGWVVVVPDFQGPQGSYLANRLAGQATLDGIRAALASEPITGISKNASVAMWGYSGGSVATTWAAELHPTYAPELRLVGAAVGGSVPKVSTVIKTINKGPLAGFIPAGVMGLASQYPELGKIVERHLLPQHKDKFYKVLNQCLLATALTFPFDDILGMFDDPDLLLSDPTCRSILDENDLGHGTPQVPFFWYKSVVDEISPIQDTEELVDAYCQRGVAIEYVRDIVADHGSAAATGAPSALAWLAGRLDGRKVKQGCTKKSKISNLLDPSSVTVLPKILVDALLDVLAHKPVGPLIG